MQRTLFLALVLALVPASLAAEQKAGQVTRVTPPASLIRPSALVRPAQPWLAIDPGTPIFWKDTLQTGERGRLRATLDDGTVLSLGSSTRLTAERHDERLQQSAILLHYGRARFQVVRLHLADSRFEVRTHNTLAATQEGGGDVLVNATDPFETLVLSMAGTVVVRSNKGESVTLTEGQYTKVRDRPSPPQRASPEELQILTKDSTAEKALEPAAEPASSVPCPQGVYQVGGGVTPPRLVHRVEPEYNEEARHAKVEGTVILQATVGCDGLIRELRVIRGLGWGLDEKAMQAVRQWRFKPGMKDGQAVSVAASIEVTFRTW